MFTGLVERVGTVISLRRNSTGARLRVKSALEGLEVGESVAVNGACQTVSETGRESFSVDVLPETLRATNFGGLRPGTLVNLERAVPAGARLGGHIVNGHVDGVGLIVGVSRNPLRLEIEVGPELLRHIVPKGSVAVDGISLTVGPAVGKGKFEIFIIPHTWSNTNLRKARVGGRVNIEVDILAKYVESFLKRESR